VQHNADSNPPLRSQMIFRRYNLDGDGIQRPQTALQDGIHVLNTATSLTLGIIELLQKV
jgi:hypothetical protein